MSVELIQTLIQASGAAGVTLMFVYYLIKRDKRDSDMVERFNHTITNHLTESNKVQSELASKLQSFTDANAELRTVIQALYKHNLKQVKIINEQNTTIEKKGK